MKVQLPKFEGRTPATAALKMAGVTESRVGSLAIDEEVFLVVKATVTGVRHKDVKEVFTRLHEVRPSAMVLVDREMGERILDEAQMLADERFGVQNLFGPGDPRDPEGG